MLRILELLGLKAVEIPTDPETGIDLNSLKKSIAKFNIKACLFITNFNNPLGCCMPDNTKKELVEMLAELEIPLIEDDIYGELYFGAQRPLTCKSFDRNGLVLYCTSVTKSIAPGFRIGWAIPGRFLEKARGVKIAYSGPTVTVTQAALAYFLGNGRYAYHLKEMRKKLYTQCLRYIQAITDYFPDDTRVSRPQGGFVLWIELNKEIDTSLLHQKALMQNVSIAPGHIFSLQPRYKNCLRISFGQPWSSEIEKGLKIIGKIAGEMIKV
jgi:DNA-binding transcriptional MocR family regulator